MSNKLEKIQGLVSRMRDVHMFKPFHYHYAVTYYKTLDEVPWDLGLKNSKNDKHFQKA